MNFRIEKKFKETTIGLIPEDWDFEELGKYANIILGQSPPSKSYNMKKEGIFFLQGNKDFGSIYPKIKTYCSKPIRIAKRGSILLSVRAPVGELNIANDDICIGRGLASLVSQNNLFLFYLLKYLNNFLINISSGTVFGSISKKDIEKIKIPKPRKLERTVISSILFSFDKKIEINNRVNIILEQISQTIFKHWFIDFEFPNEQGKPYKSSGGKLVESELGSIPRNWSVGFLGDGNLTKFIKSGILKFSGEKIYLATADVNNNNITNLDTKITFNNRPSRANMQPITSSIWFAKMKESKKILFFDNYHKFELENIILSTGFAGLKVKQYALYFIWCFISNNNFEKIKDNYCIGTTMQAINNENIKKIKYIIPEKDTLIKFNELIKILYEKINNNNLENIHLSQIRDALLPKLITGKIRVNLENTRES